MHMKNLKNSTLVESAIKAIYTAASRRTTSKFADEAIGSTIKTLEGKYDFLRYVDIDKNSFSDGGFAIHVSPDIDSVHPVRVGKAIESIIRVVYNDLNEEAGLYFVTELRQYAGGETTKGMIDREIDLDQIQLEQRYAYRRRERKKSISKAVRERKPGRKQPANLLGYTWGKVTKWKHEPNSNFCTLYDKNGKVLDRLNLDMIIQNYVEKLSDFIEADPVEIERQTRIYEKEYELLKLMFEKDMDAETAMHYLHISKEELDDMIRKLSKMEMLQFVSYDTLEITDSAISYLSEKETKDKKVDKKEKKDIEVA